jgi:glucosyl-dolichyl phosphate glucuronosyltransferase
MALTFSIIIPTYNRCAVLARTLESLTKITSQDHAFEVLIVDNGSTDGTATMVEEFRSKRSRQQWRFLSEPMPGLLSGRHRGALESSCDICVFIDDDVRLDPEWLNGFHDAFKDPSVVMAGGSSRPLFEKKPPSWLEPFQLSGEAGRVCVPLSLFDGGNKIKEIDPIYVFGLNFAIRRETLFAQGGFHPDYLPRTLQRYQGDGETGLSMKVKRSGLKALYHPAASLRHEIPASRLTRKYFTRHAFYHGVCDSYSQVRAERAIRPNAPQDKYLLARAKDKIPDWLFPKSAAHYIAMTTRAYQEGFAFHQNEIRRDPSLLNWVLRPDYWDYQLPAGWKQYL